MHCIAVRCVCLRYDYVLPATLDMAGWEGGADFAADMTFDLWNLTGGLGKFAGWSRGAKGIADDLLSLIHI